MVTEFRILDQDEYSKWDSFVERSPQGSLFAKTFYLNAIGKPYKIGVLSKGDSIEGGVVLAKNEIRTYSNPLFAKYLGILLRPVDGKYVNRISKEKKIIEEIVLNLKRCRSFDYTFHPSFDNWLPFYWNGFSQETRYTYRISEMGDIKNIHNNMDSITRNEIRKAQKNNIQVTTQIPLEEFYRINDLTFRRQGGAIPYSFGFLKKFHGQLKKHDAVHLFGAADDSGHYHAVSGIVFDKKCCYLIMNGIDHNMPKVGANVLLIMNTIEFAAKVSGMFDFEGSMIKPVESFYRGFGGILTPYFNIWRNNFSNSSKRLAIKIYKKIKYGK
jgi:hypothetical protein